MKQFIRKIIPHILVVTGVLFVCAFIRYELQIISVSGPSMEPTISDGRILKYDDWNPKETCRGDIILFRENGTGKTLIKRIIGLPGEEISIFNGAICIDGETLTSYTYGSIEDAGILKDAPLLLADDEYFCLGDNYAESRDCRVFGPVKDEWITGLILWRE